MLEILVRHLYQDLMRRISTRLGRRSAGRFGVMSRVLVVGRAYQLPVPVLYYTHCSWLQCLLQEYVRFSMPSWLSHVCWDGGHCFDCVLGDAQVLTLPGQQCHYNFLQQFEQGTGIRVHIYCSTVAFDFMVEMGMNEGRAPKMCQARIHQLSTNACSSGGAAVQPGTLVC